MITALELENFKCFESLHLAFGGLTLLTGFNAGGKSSATQPLLLLAQGLRSGTSPSVFPLNGPLVRLGTVGDVLPSYADPASGKGQIAFRVATATSEAHWAFVARPGQRYLTVADSDRGLIESHARVLAQLAKLAYISAVREGAADAFPMPDEGVSVPGNPGTDGRFAPYHYDQSVDNEVSERRRHPREPATSLRKQLDAWLGTLFPGAQGNVQSLPQVSMVGLQFRLSEIGNWRRPANVGYGLTYAFPILVALLLAEDGQLVIIDSPEAHLHPFAQSQMGRILAFFAAAGVQIVVETHSDHLLNGVRLAVRDHHLPNSALAIHFFTRASREGHGVISPTVDVAGRIDEWPEGFFDQSERDLAELAGWT